MLQIRGGNLHITNRLWWFWLVEELGVGGAGSPELSAMRKKQTPLLVWYTTLMQYLVRTRP